MTYYGVGYHVDGFCEVEIFNLITTTFVMFSLYLRLFVKVFFEAVHAVALFFYFIIIVFF